MTTRLINASLVVVFILGAWRLGQAQGQVARFHVTIQRTDTGVKMECSQGCAWTKLSFSFSGDRAQAVDETGVVEK